MRVRPLPLRPALSELVVAGVAFESVEPTDGRPRTVWRHVRYQGGAPLAHDADDGLSPETESC